MKRHLLALVIGLLLLFALMDALKTSDPSPQQRMMEELHEHLR